MIMNSVFATLRLSLFAFSQQLRFSGSDFIIGSRSARVRPGMLILVSSANIFEQAVVRQFGRSLMYIRKKGEPNILPCGTRSVSLAFDRAPMTLHF